MTPHHDPTTTPITLLTLVTLGYLAWYAFACWVWPFTTCRRCSGTGKRPAWIGSGFRFCRRCGGTGHRLRFGRWLHNHLRRVYTRP